MMTGRLYIDGKDIYTEFGVAVVEGGYNELVSYPPLKEVTTNDWQEEDGIEADLSAPVLNTRELTINFVAMRGVEGLGALADLLSDMAYHTFYHGRMNRKYRLRLVKQPNLQWSLQLGFVGFRFADDFPMEGYSYQPPVSTVSAYGDYTLDDRLLTDYGVRVLQGTLASIDKSPDVKPNLLRNIKTRAGAIYDNSRVTFKSKEVQVNCLMRAETMEEFWRNYDALLYDLTRPNERSLFVEVRGRKFPCYYKSCKTVKFYYTGKIWWEFTLTLVFTSYRLKGKRPALRFVSDGGLRLLQNGNFKLT